MANFLRRLVRSKSRSKSPQKAHCPPPPVVELGDDEWGVRASPPMGDGGGKCQHMLVTNHIGGTRRRAAPRITTIERHHHPNHIPPPSPSSSRHPPLHHRPPSHMSSHHHHSPESGRRLFSPTAATDEPGTSSQEFLSPTLWPSSPAVQPVPWSLRNSHSNPESAAGGAGRPSSRTTILPKDDEVSSTTQTLSNQPRPRSSSPRKPASAAKSVAGESNERLKGRSRSPAKKPPSGMAKTMDYLQAQCRLEGCSATILVEDTRFLVCKHQLSHASDFFRSLFLNSRALPLEGVRQVQADEYVVQVSSLRHPPQALQFQWFLETTVPNPMLRDISDELLESCMRLCKRFAARGLEMRCTRFIQDNVEAKPPMMALCWLNWTFKHRFHRAVQQACLPVVARLPLHTLEKHRQMVPETVFGDLLAMKLRTAYQQAGTVFHTIHRMDHFHVEMDKCPRCGRQREQGRVRVGASPCHKLIGCERCMREFPCELETPASAPQDMQAYWQCEHGLWPFSERTEDCRCQTPLYRANRQASGEVASATATTRPRPGVAGSNLTLASKQPSSSAASRS